TRSTSPVATSPATLSADRGMPLAGAEATRSSLFGVPWAGEGNRKAPGPGGGAAVPNPGRRGGGCRSAARCPAPPRPHTPLVAGRAKLREYRAVVALAPAPDPPDPAALFPKASEAQERYAVAQAKLAFYQLLFLVGQLLAATGVLLMGIGAFRQRLRSLRSAPSGAALH